MLFFLSPEPLSVLDRSTGSFYIKHRRTTLGRTPLKEGSVCRRDLYLTTHNKHKRQIPILLARFEPEIPSSERPHTHALDRAATGTGTSRTRIMQQIIQFFDKPLALIRNPEQTNPLRKSLLQQFVTCRSIRPIVPYNVHTTIRGLRSARLATVWTVSCTSPHTAHCCAPCLSQTPLQVPTPHCLHHIRSHFVSFLLWCPTYPPPCTSLWLRKTRKIRRKNGKGRKKKSQNTYWQPLLIVVTSNS